MEQYAICPGCSSSYYIFIHMKDYNSTITHKCTNPNCKKVFEIKTKESYIIPDSVLKEIMDTIPDKMLSYIEYISNMLIPEFQKENNSELEYSIFAIEQMLYFLVSHIIEIKDTYLFEAWLMKNKIVRISLKEHLDSIGYKSSFLENFILNITEMYREAVIIRE